jgi:hypothetical protein
MLHIREALLEMLDEKKKTEFHKQNPASPTVSVITPSQVSSRRRTSS